MTILLTGGSGCGKSAYAEKLVAAMPEENRVYIATMQICDRECERRVARHIQRRAGLRFRTVEQPKSLEEAPVEPGSVVLLEDLPDLRALSAAVRRCAGGGVRGPRARAGAVLVALA